MPRRTARSGQPQDERAGFFRDLRELRARRGLSIADIAERTRFSAEMLAAVESGPELPSLPALEAYLRGCGEPLAAWEDRWGRLGPDAAEGVADGEDLPVRDAGASPLAVAGAALAGAPAGPADGGRPADTGKRLGAGSGRKRPPTASGRRVPTASGRRVPTASGRRVPTASGRRGPVLPYVAAAAATALLASGGVALLAWSHGTGGHRGLATTAPRSPGTRSPGTPSPGAGATGGVSVGGGNSPGPAPPRDARLHSASVVPRPQAAAVRPEVAGIGCPQGNVAVVNAPNGPGWTISDGGWTGDGCDGSAVWTMDPNGNQPVPSAVTWKFGLAAGVSHCTVAVFVPTNNALGVGEYSVFTGAGPTVADIASVAISQATAAGQWVTLGSYPVRGTSLEVQVAPAAAAPGDPGPETHGRQHAAGQEPGHNAAIAASAARAACA